MKEGGHGNERFACYRLNQHPHLMNDPLSPTTGQSLFDLVYHDTKNGWTSCSLIFYSVR